MSYIVPPGLYAVGSPDGSSPVVVTANYKMSYDLVRRSLQGRSVWLMVLETYGINVWCAAGKGTFGTGELIRRIETTKLADIVSHRQLVLPLLGAAGVKAVDVRKRSGFSVNFAAVRAEDIPAWLDSEGTTSPEMRELTFTLYERIILTPVEIVSFLRKSAPLLVLTFTAAAYSAGTFNSGNGLLALSAYLTALITGTVIAPALLHWLPTRSFAIKGAVAGAVAAGLFIPIAGVSSAFYVAALLLLMTAVSSFALLSFTGSTPYTSRSGVKFEMKYALPLQGAGLLFGVISALLGRLS